MISLLLVLLAATPLFEMKEEGKKLFENPKYAEKVHKSIAARLKSESHIDHRNTFIGSSISSSPLFINASKIPTEGQDFILAALPQDHQKAEAFWKVTLDLGCTLFISAHEEEEAKSKGKIHDFWHQKSLDRLKFDNGMTIQVVASKVIATGIQEPDGKRVPRLIETTLQTSDGRTLTHIHYDAWRDRHTCPDEFLLIKLHDRMVELSKNPRIPVVINCQGGVGRSGTIAVSYTLRKHIDKALNSGKSIHTISLDPTSLILHFRKYRSGAVANPDHFPTLYVTAEHYGRRLLVQNILGLSSPDMCQKMVEYLIGPPLTHGVKVKR